MKELLIYIITSILDIGADQLQIEHQESPNEHIFTVQIDIDKIGLIIGKKGSVIKSIRQLLAVKIQDTRKNISIKVLPKTA